MRNMAGSYPEPDSRDDNYFSIASDLVSLIERLQASMTMLEQAIARELPLGDLEASDNVVVLDDVTPCYVEAKAALNACKAGLGVALHRLLDADTSDKAWRSGALAGSDCGSAGLADCA